MAGRFSFLRSGLRQAQGAQFSRNASTKAGQVSPLPHLATISRFYPLGCHAMASGVAEIVVSTSESSQNPVLTVL